jgi:hypothetical protein
VPIALALVAILAAACYDPSLRDCAVACRNGGDCATGQICGDDGWCAAPAVAGRCDAARDASEPDEPDAEAPIEPAVFDCSGEDDCDMEIRCPPGVPCVIVCTGDGACPKRIHCEEAWSCEIDCGGVDSCADEVRCGAGPCTVACTGAGSCAKKTKCAESCDCDVDCSGEAACADGSDCPDGCAAGAGCTSDLAGCDSC